jgi:ParB family chromosome partitioning protein
VAVDKMWDVLRFLKSPQGEQAEAPDKVRIDDRLIEAIEAAEGVADRIRAQERSDVPEPPRESLREEEPRGAVPAETRGVGVPAEEASAGPERTLLRIPLSSIRPNPFQPRMVMDEAEIEELAASIREVGLLQPILVKPSGAGYELIAGERRWRAARKADLREIPALVVDVDESTQHLLALVENLQRRNLSAVEEGKSLSDLIERTGMSQTELARRLGRSQASVANKIRLLKLDPAVQQLVVDGKLGERQARSLLSLPRDRQREMAERALVEDLNARDMEALVEVSSPAPEVSPQVPEPVAPEPVVSEGDPSSEPESPPIPYGEVSALEAVVRSSQEPAKPDPTEEAAPAPVRRRGRPRKVEAEPRDEGPGPGGPAGELLHDVALLVNKHRGRGIPAQWKVRELAQNALIVEIMVDLKAVSR